MRSWARVAALLPLLGAVPAAAEPMLTLLDAVARNARFPVPTRADVRLERQRRDVTAVVQMVLVGHRHTIYIETRDGTRALVRPSKILLRTGTKIVRSALGARLAESDVLFEDLAVFTPSLLKVPQVSDDGPTGIVVTGAPGRPSERSLIVLTIDPVTHAVTRTKYFAGSISDLEAFRRDDAFLSVDGHERPGRISIDGPRDRTWTHLDLTWRLAPEVPQGLFTLRGLRSASPITW